MFVACESDHDKMERLNGDAAVQCTLAQKYEKEYEFVAAQVKTPLQDSLARMSTKYRTNCDLAQRELNKFMHE
jgi:hypothetical protein